MRVVVANDHSGVEARIVAAVVTMARRIGRRNARRRSRIRPGSAAGARRARVGRLPPLMRILPSPAPARSYTSAWGCWQDGKRGLFELVVAEALDRVSRDWADVVTLY